MGCSGSHGTITVLDGAQTRANGSLLSPCDELNDSQLSVAANVRRVSDVPPLEGADPPSEEIPDGGSRTRPVTPRILIRKYRVWCRFVGLEDRLLFQRHRPHLRYHLMVIAIVS